MFRSVFRSVFHGRGSISCFVRKSRRHGCYGCLGVFHSWGRAVALRTVLRALL